MDEASRRDRHLFGPGPKRILALDGGGVRGAISIAFLERLEAVLDGAAGREVRLCDHFDLIGGTSTGAIIATALALGFRASDIRAFYEELAPRVFYKPFYRLVGLQAKFDSRRLRAELERVIGPRRLDSEDLQTGLAVILKRMDTGSSWIVMNNPRSIFWNTPPDGAFHGNREIALVNLVRASAAAPHYFDPELIEVTPAAPPGLFVDGGLTPHNNPSLMLLMHALLPQYGLNWRTGPEELTVVSIGTGSFRPRLSAAQARRSGAIGLAIASLAAQISDNQNLVLMLMSWLGQGSQDWPVNSEVGSLADTAPPFGHLFRFLRYDIVLDADWLKASLGEEVDAQQVALLRHMDRPANIPLAYRLATKAAARQVDPADWPIAGAS
ncbi:patatin-like phospholipase family protein [Bosea sp. 117]|uniref:patatin-like phospholipase family protein n=1 Tax=Bosea sp. 117 TaxID=1125973 RepID=UPI0004944F57|nr:patatin-like phospholipase family protein [Bosea sp. 117]